MTPRPLTLAAVAAESASLEDFGRHLRDWQHELRRMSTRRQVADAIAVEPPRLQATFVNGAVADAWLAAYAELAAARARVPMPAWATAPDRVAPEPWFADTTGSPVLRWLALRDSPLPFKRRNLFLATPDADLPLRLRRGRPAKPPEELRRHNAARQRRFRQRRATALAALHREVKRLRRQAAEG